LTLREGVNLALLLPNVSPLQRELDVVLLHEGILEPALGITPQAVTAGSESHLRAGSRCGIRCRGPRPRANLVSSEPCDVDQVMKIATSGEVMPQKSTDFYPKLMSGIAMYRVES